jgi:acyl-CoA thioesterase
VNPSARFGDSPFHRWLAIEPVSHSPEHAEIRMEPRAEFAQEAGVVQGGLLTALADAAGVYLLLGHAPAGERLTSIELKVNFLRPGRPDGATLVARAAPVRVGGTIAVVRAEVVQGGEAVLAGLFTYLRAPAAGSTDRRASRAP